MPIARRTHLTNAIPFTPTIVDVSGRTTGKTTQTDTSSKLNPGKSQGRPNEKHGLEAHRAKRPTRLRPPNERPCPRSAEPTTGPGRNLQEHFHPAKSTRPDPATSLLVSMQRSSLLRDLAPGSISGHSRASLVGVGIAPTPADLAIPFAATGSPGPSTGGQALRREAVAQPFGLGPVAVTGVMALTVSTVVRACSGPGGGEVVAVQLGEVVGCHQ
jgi:hypothetical protein